MILKVLISYFCSFWMGYSDIMKKTVMILSHRARLRSPGMCCVVEMENVLMDEYDAIMIDPSGPLPTGDQSNTIAIFTAISFKSISLYIDFFIALKQRGATVVIYIYDSWDAANFFYNRKRRLKSRLFPKLKISSFCDWLVVPFEQSVAEFSVEDRDRVFHLPLGVDSTLVDGLNEDRPLTVLAYGRQPDNILATFSDALNTPGTPFFMHHTDHMHVNSIHNYLTHRRHFWKLAEKSAVALAYDPKETHSHRFPYSITSQRWFESLAAGCAVVGIRPKTPEANKLLNWPNATIETPPSAQETLSLVLDLANDTVRLREIRERNVANIRAHHDWRARFKVFFDAILPA